MDVDLRERERDAAQDPSKAKALIRTRIRGGQPIPAYHLETSGHHKVIFPGAECSRVLNLRAYLGCEESLDVLDCCPLDNAYPRGGPHILSPPISGRRRGDERYGMACPACQPKAAVRDWLIGLQPLIENLPDVEVMVAARDCAEFGNYGHRSSVCGCDIHQVPYARYISILVAWEVAKLTFVEWSLEAEEHAAAVGLSAALQIAQAQVALNTCENWLRCPCPEHFTKVWELIVRGEELPMFPLAVLASISATEDGNREEAVEAVLSAAEELDVTTEQIRAAICPHDLD